MTGRAGFRRSGLQPEMLSSSGPRAHLSAARGHTTESQLCAWLVHPPHVTFGLGADLIFDPSKGGGSSTQPGRNQGYIALMFLGFESQRRAGEESLCLSQDESREGKHFSGSCVVEQKAVQLTGFIQFPVMPGACRAVSESRDDSWPIL